MKKSKGTLEGLYDMVGYNPKQSLKEKLQEQDFKKTIANNNKLCRRNIEIFKDNDKCYLDCIRYSPCRICDKCENKASNLYVKCQTCELPQCTHKYSDVKFMIRRDNFKINVDKKTFVKFKNLLKED